MEKKILIVDDEVHICALLAQTLEELVDAGVELLIAHDGEAGLQLAMAERPSLLLLDVMLPKMDGYQVCASIKETPELQAMHIIMLTAKGQAIDKLRGAEVQVDEYITKPFDPDMILQKASAILQIAL
jgi:two-component system alkaline phosphatase synthesis response regulator PhoP